MGRTAGKPVHKPDRLSRELVSLHATVGTPHATIAKILDVDIKTLAKNYRAELDESLARANATIGGVLFNKAKGGDTSSMIFWLKTRARWRETQHIDHSNEDGTMRPTKIVLVAAEFDDSDL